MREDGTFPNLTEADLAPSDEYLAVYKDGAALAKRICVGVPAMPFRSGPDCQETYNPTRTIVTIHKSMNKTYGDK